MLNHQSWDGSAVECLCDSSEDDGCIMEKATGGGESLYWA